MCAIKRCKNSSDYCTLWRRSLPTNQRRGNLSSSSRHSWSAVDETKRQLSVQPQCVTVNDYPPFTASHLISALFSQHQQVVKILLWLLRPEKRGLIPPNGEQNKRKRKAAHYGYFHPEKWNIKHVHYTLNLQLFLIAHGHFPIFPALLLAQRSGPWEKSLFYYLNPCTGAEPGESSHVC